MNLKTNTQLKKFFLFGIKNGFKKLPLNFIVYILIIISIEFFGNTEYTINTKYLTSLLTITVVFSSLLIIFPLLNKEYKLIFFEHAQYIIQKYAIITETGLGLLLVYSASKYYFGAYFIILFILYFWISILICGNKAIEATE